MGYATLNVLGGGFRGQALPIRKRAIVLGRDEGCDLVLEGYAGVSRRHARLVWDGKSFSLHDLGSTNGTLAAASVVPLSQGAALAAGDRIKLGDFEAQLWLPAGRPVFDGDRQPGILSSKWQNLPVAGRWASLAVVIVILVGGRAVSKRRKTAVSRSIESELQAATSVDGANSRQNLPAIPSTDTVLPVAPVNGKISPVAIRNTEAATVMIAQRRGRDWSFGSGFVVGDALHVVTNRHVVAEDGGQAGNCVLIFHCGTAQQIKVAIAASGIVLAPSSGGDGFTDDLAVITLPTPIAAALPLGQAEALTESDTVYAIGFPLGIEALTIDNTLPSVSVKAVTIERLQTGEVDGKTEVTIMQLGGTVTHGNSGGPVVNDRGEVVGVISRGAEGTGMSYAIPAATLKKLLPARAN